MQPGPIVALVKETFAEWQEDRAERLAAALAYYAAFSLGPLLLIAISVAGLAFGEEAARGQVVAQLTGLVGQEGAEVVETAIKNANQPASSIIATVIGLTLLVLGASGLFGQLQDALNTIWEVPPRPNEGIKGMIGKRLLSMTMVLGIGFLLLTSLALSAVLAALGSWLSDQMPGGALLWQVVNQIVSLAVITLLFAMIFKVLPDTNIAWRDVWIGAFLTSVLFTIGKLLIGLYLGYVSVGSAYGAAGSLLVVLVWIYYSAQILFIGAEFTQVYANRYGSRTRSTTAAEPSEDTARTEQDRVRAEPASSERERAPVGVAAHPMASAPPSAMASTSLSGDESRPASPRKPDMIVIGALLLTTAVAVRRLLAHGRHDRPAV